MTESMSLADPNRKRTSHIGVESQIKVREIIRPSRAQLPAWQEKAPFYLEMSMRHALPPGSFVRLAADIETTIASVRAEQARLDASLADEPPSISSDGRVADIRKALDQVVARLLEARRNLAT